MRIIAVLLALIATPALAQDYSSMQSRLDRIERDLTFVQRQVYSGNAADPNGGTPVAGGAASTQIMQLQEENRNLRGQIEQADFKAQQAQNDLKKLQQDMEYRIQQLEQSATAAPAPMSPEAAATMPAPAAAATPAAPARSTGFNVNEGASAGEPAPEAAQYEPEAAAAAAPAASSEFTTPKEHYNHAFQLLNQAQYEDAASSFSSFTKKYPKDALAPNAYYWMGESYYARRNFKSAAEGFRKGYEANPKGQKAADNLLKLSLSLANLKRLDEACIVLKQVSAQYATTNKTTATKADSEYKRLSCA